MLTYVFRAASGSLLTIWIIVTIAFGVVRLAPGSPAEIMLGDRATPALVERLEDEMGLDRPLPQQYVQFLGELVRGDLGRSLLSNRSVSQDLVHLYPFTFQLMAASILLAISVGLPMGILSAIRPRSLLDLLSTSGAVFWLSIPSFSLGLLLLLIFSMHLEWFPVSGAGDQSDLRSLLLHLALPAFAAGARQIAVIARLSRSTMLDVLDQDYIRTARAKGLPERLVIRRHALRNAFPPILSIIGIEIVILLGGAVVVENVFGRPGVGRLLVAAVAQQDYPVVQGALFFLAVVVIIVNLLTDIGYAWLDRRVQYA